MQPLPAHLYGIGPRSREAWRLYALGYRTVEAASVMGITDHTVRHHLNIARMETGAHTWRDLAVLALLIGLVTPAEVYAHTARRTQEWLRSIGYDPPEGTPPQEP